MNDIIDRGRHSIQKYGIHSTSPIEALVQSLQLSIICLNDNISVRTITLIVM